MQGSGPTYTESGYTVAQRLRHTASASLMHFPLVFKTVSDQADSVLLKILDLSVREFHTPETHTLARALLPCIKNGPFRYTAKEPPGRGEDDREGKKRSLHILPSFEC